MHIWETKEKKQTSRKCHQHNDDGADIIVTYMNAKEKVGKWFPFAITTDINSATLYTEKKLGAARNVSKFTKFWEAFNNLNFLGNKITDWNSPLQIYEDFNNREVKWKV